MKDQNRPANLERDDVDRRTFVKLSGTLIAFVKLLPLSEVLAPPTASTAAIPPVTLTPQASAEILKIAQRGGFFDVHGASILRIGYSIEDADTLKLMMGFDDPSSITDDVVHEMHGIRLAIARDCVDKMRGTLVEYIELPGKTGFTFDNPQWKLSNTKLA
jgi:Fe-S cluster assembly iron-binding protein IscA